MAATEAKPDIAAVQRVERAALDAWPAFQCVWDGDWVLRATKGYTKRSNSIQCMDPGDDRDCESRLLALAGRARELGIRPVFRRTPLAPAPMDDLLDTLGWDRFEQSQIRILPQLTADYAVDKRVDLIAPTDPAWISEQSRMAGHDAKTRAILMEILRRLPQSAAGVVCHTDTGVPGATCLVMIVNGVAFINNVVTDATLRRQGLGRAMMGAALNFARKQGAEAASIHVLADNAPAIALYQSLGFAWAGDYIYRRAPQ